MSWNPGTSRWEFSSGWDGTVSVQYLVQVVDGAGNVSLSNQKGAYYVAEPQKLYLPVVLRSYTP